MNSIGFFEELNLDQRRLPNTVIASSGIVLDRVEAAIEFVQDERLRKKCVQTCGRLTHQILAELIRPLG